MSDLESKPEALPEGAERAPRGVGTMAIVRWLLVIAMAGAAAASLLNYFGYSLGQRHTTQDTKLFYCPMHPQIIQDHPGECPICSMTLVPMPKGQLLPSATMTTQPQAKPDAAAQGNFYCPMHPQIASDDPKATCPLCGGMPLVARPPTPEPAVSPGVPGLVPIDIPADRVQKIGMRTATVSRQTLTGILRTSGAVTANERGLAQINPRFGGWIDKLFVEETGKRVSRGQILATIYSPELLQAQQELVSALRWSASPAEASSKHAGHSETAQELVADARHRLELLGIAPQEIETIVREKQTRRAIELRSPVDGHVVVKNAVRGMAVVPGTPLFEIADLSTVWVIAEIYESDVSRVRIGQPAAFESASFPGETFKGKIQFIYPNLDPSTRTLRIRLQLANRAGTGGLKLRPGMFGTMSLDLPTTDGLVVPTEAVVDTGDLQYVYVMKGEGHFEPRSVKIGGHTGANAIVTTGLSAGEVVVTTANFLIDSESRLRAAVQGAGKTANAPTPPAHKH